MNPRPSDYESLALPLSYAGTSYDNVYHFFGRASNSSKPLTVGKGCGNVRNMKKEESRKSALTKEDLSDTLSEFFGEQIEPRFNRIELYIQKQIEPRFDRIESYIQKQIEPRLDRIDKKLEEHDKKFDDLLNHFGQIYN